MHMTWNSSLIWQCSEVVGWQDDLEVLSSKFSILGLNPDLAINYHPGVSQAGVIHQCVCRPSDMDVKLGVSSAGITWWALKIQRCPLRRVGELLLAH